jgi:hypothetical protein
MTEPNCRAPQPQAVVRVCGAEAPPLVGSVLTGTGLTLAQAASALDRGETPPLSEVQRRIVEEWAQDPQRLARSI